MTSTGFRIGKGTMLRRVVGVLVAAGVSGVGAAAQAPDWRPSFAAGEEARAAGDHGAYGRHMAEAVSLMPPGFINRPFAQYHAARGHALAGDGDGAVRFLTMAWDEGIESLMITFADHDPAFAGLRGEQAYRDLMARVAAMTLEVVHLGGNVHLIRGAGSNLVASVGADGVFLVDTGYGAALPALRAALAGLGAGGVDALVITHPHEDHWGGAAALAAEARVYAHPGTVAAMAEPYTFMEGVVLPRRPESLRDAVVALDEGTVFFNGETVRLVPVAAHTGGDVAVVFPESRVAHLGDAYLAGNPMMFPGAADPEGFLDRFDALLDALPEGTVVVAGHDGPVGVDAVRAQIAESRACMALVREALAQGLDRDQTVARAEGRFAAPWVRFFYGALSDGNGIGGA